MLDATLARLRTDGYEGARVADIAADSGVALATIYRYFGSRENLIYTAVHTWVTTTSRRSFPADGAQTLEERLSEMIRTSAEQLIEEPELLRAWARARLTPDGFVAEHMLRDTLADTLLIFPDEVLADPTLAVDLGLIMGHAWFSGVVKWSLEQMTYDDVWGDVQLAMRIVMRADR